VVAQAVVPLAVMGPPGVTEQLAMMALTVATVSLVQMVDHHPSSVAKAFVVNSSKVGPVSVLSFVHSYLEAAAKTTKRYVKALEMALMAKSQSLAASLVTSAGTLRSAVRRAMALMHAKASVLAIVVRTVSTSAAASRISVPRVLRKISALVERTTPHLELTAHHSKATVATVANAWGTLRSQDVRPTGTYDSHPSGLIIFVK
jgi:hypothetical protein